MNIEVTLLSKEEVEGKYHSFLDRYENVRLIPQVHKFLDVR